MARNVVLVAFGIVVGALGGAACGIHAQDTDAQAELELAQAAFEAGVDPTDLLGAAHTVGLSPRGYAIAHGLIPSPNPAPPPRDGIDVLLDCLAWAESRNTPSARNPSSGASGLLQFLPSTWRSTPYGNLSIWDASAQRLAGRWMIQQGRLREWVTWRQCA